MISFEAEIESVRDLLGEANARELIAEERREVVSLHPEIRFLAWAGVSLVAAAASVFIANNHDRIGPLVIIIAIALAAAACYAFAFWRRERVSPLNEYVLLLGALLVSADVAFLESQFHLLGDDWLRHLLILAVVHGATAYAFDSRAVLTLSIAALASWIGAERYDGRIDDGERALRFFLAAGTLVVWTFLDRRYRLARTFDRTFEHFVATLAFFGGLTLVFHAPTRPAGVAITLAIATLTIVWGVRHDAEPFVLYAIVYAVVAVDGLLFDVLRNEALQLLLAMFSIVAALTLLFLVHAHFRRET